MTSTRTDPDDAPDTISAAERAQTFLDWTRINATALTVGAAVIVVAAAGYWFYLRSQQIQSANAEKALSNAKQSMSAGNLTLAQSDLQKVYSRYESTVAGVEAAMLLAQIDFDGGKAQDGITMLEKLSGSSAASRMQSTILGLEGDGYMQLGKAAEAAKHYESAANATTFETERAFAKSKAARAYQIAGDTAKARQLWASLLNDPTAQAMATEARVRLGELTAQVAKK
ncbi:MAG TPA: tetratricopeptide repeat protein [Gemmatimonadaceae bacterium]